jgi:hypothetical protein
MAVIKLVKSITTIFIDGQDGHGFLFYLYVWAAYAYKHKVVSVLSVFTFLCENF